MLVRETYLVRPNSDSNSLIKSESVLSYVGFVVEFVSMPVTGGFISAAAILMASSQLKGLFGISYHAKNCLEMWIKFVENIKHFRIADTAMGLTCIFVLIGLKVST